MSKESRAWALCLQKHRERSWDGSYYGSLTHRNLEKKSQVTKWYKVEYVEVTAESFRECALELSKVVSVNKGQRHPLWAIPAQFCAAPYSSDPRCLPGDEKSRERKRLSPKETNGVFESAALKSRADYEQQEILHMVTLKAIKTAKKLLAN